MKASLLLALAGLSISTTEAAEPTGTVALACNGTKTDDIPDAKSEPISISIIIDFKARTIEGDLASVMTITDVTETNITFKGSEVNGKVYSYQIGGTINRVTGAMEAVQASVLRERWSWTTNYSLKCKPTQRMF
jgi:hypothetical protein